MVAINDNSRFDSENIVMVLIANNKTRNIPQNVFLEIKIIDFLFIFSKSCIHHFLNEPKIGTIPYEFIPAVPVPF